MNKKPAKKILIFLSVVVISVLSIRITLYFLPYKALDEFKKKPYSIALLDRSSDLLRVLPLSDGGKREYIELSKIPKAVKEIFIKSEDKRFYFHFGIDPIAFVRSIIQLAKYNRVVSGASTITMQLARIISPHDPSIKGKFKEAFNAIRLESKLSKNKILELWLNSIPFGQQAVGVESASKIYFGKDLNELTYAQILGLSIIPRRPSKYNTFENSGILIQATTELAKKFKLKITEQEITEGIKNTQNYNWIYKSPHFVNYVQKNLTGEQLAKGAAIRTSLDLELNNFTQQRIKHYIDLYKQYRLINGACLVIDNRTGEILSYVGSQDFDDKENFGEIDGVHVTNQPGSTIKPFLYAMALDKGFMPCSILPDIPQDYGSENVYVPLNYNLRFNGPVRLRVALASSLNVCSVYLVTRLGVKNFINRLLDLDFKSLDTQKDRLGASIAVGNLEISLFEIVSAFSIFPRHGEKNNLTFIARKSKEFIPGNRIYSEYASELICDILSDNPSRSIGFSTRTILNTNFPAMFKTGTSNQFGNIWAIGATPDFTVGVWIGNFHGETIIGKTGSSLPASIVVEVLTRLTKVNKGFNLNPDFQKVIICPLSGGLVTDACPGAVYEYLAKGIKLKNCSYHFIENGNVKVKFPVEFSSWAKKYDVSKSFEDDGINSRFPRIVKPINGAVFYFDPTIDPKEQVVKIEVVNKDINETLSVFVNGNKFKSLAYPFTMLFPVKKGTWEIEVKGMADSDMVSFKVE